MTTGGSVSNRASTADVAQRDILILGLGDVLAGDEGVGIHVLNTLDKYPALTGVTLVDGGTGGVNLLQPIATSPIVIAIAATRDGRPAGTISVLRPAAVREMPVQVCAVESGLQDLFAAATLLGRLPEVHLFTVSVEGARTVTMALTEPIAAAVAETARLVNTLAVRLLALKMDIPE